MPAIVPKVNTASNKINNHAGISASIPNVRTRLSQAMPTTRISKAFQIFSISITRIIIPKKKKMIQPKANNTLESTNIAELFRAERTPGAVAVSQGKRQEAGVKVVNKGLDSMSNKSQKLSLYAVSRIFMSTALLYGKMRENEAG